MKNIWIDKEFKKEYIGSAKQAGIRIKYDNEINLELICEYKEFIKWLRNKYYFPIRINVFFYDVYKFKSKKDGHTYYGVFFEGENNKKKIYPQIHLAAKTNKVEDVLFGLIHELSHYFQWFFYEDNKRSDRSLEIEANKYAKYILFRYYDEKTMQRPA